MDLSDIDEEYAGFGKLKYKNIDNYNLSSDENNCDTKNKPSNQLKSKTQKNYLPSSTCEPGTKKPRVRKKKSASCASDDKVRERKQLAREKLELKIEKRRIKNIEPGECMKFIKVYFHNNISKFNFYDETISMLDASSVDYFTNISLPAPNSISWRRIVEEYSIDHDNKVSTSTSEQQEKFLLIIWTWDKVIQLIHEKLFVSAVTSLYNSVREMNVTLVIYGVEKYFEYHESKGKKKTSNKMYGCIDDIPKVSRNLFDGNLIQIQILAKCNSRLIEEPADMSLLIYQFTKSIAEIPYKLEMDKKLNDQLDFYATGDNKNTIQVDREGYGLKKLWLKQLCIFNNSSLAVADAISSVYSSPQQLIQAYLNCSREDGENLLKDIPIKRSITSTAASRKLGPELSKKIYTLFTSRNGNQSLQMDK